MMLEVAIRTEGDRRTLTVTGTVDLESSPRLWMELDSAFAGVRTVRVDLAGVSYIDSSGIATLVRGLRHAKKMNSAIVLANPSPQVKAVLSLANLERVFLIESDG